MMSCRSSEQTNALTGTLEGFPLVELLPMRQNLRAYNEKMWSICAIFINKKTQKKGPWPPNHSIAASCRHPYKRFILIFLNAVIATVLFL